MVVEDAMRTPGSVSTAVARTPATRDRYVDLLRAASIVLVVFGHWLITVAVWDHGELDAHSVLTDVPLAQLLTWVFQVVPLFFAVGGVANMLALRSARHTGRGTGPYLGGRVMRLTVPVLPLAAVWLAAGPLLRAVGVDPAAVDRALHVTAQPIWFLAVYLVVVAAAPLLLAAHERVRWAVPIALAVLAGAGDVVSVAAPSVGWLNYVVVLAFAHQLGFFYSDGTAASWSRARLAMVATAAFAGLVALAAGPYPVSMVGVSGASRSNMSPPSVCIVVLAVWQCALALLARPALDSWVHHRRPWAAVVAVNGSVMTIFLWHLTATVLAVGIVLPLGFPTAPPGTPRWWLLRPLWLALLAVLLAGLVAVFGGVERRWRISAPVSVTMGAAAAVTAALAMVALADAGFGAPSALPAAVVLAVVAVLMHGAPFHGHWVRRSVPQ
jgi:fucose 4-O-acetylase-like acetyltransferase